MLSPLPIVYRTPCLWYFDHPPLFTHGISDPVYNLTPLPMLYQIPLPIVYPWYIECLWLSTPPPHVYIIFILLPIDISNSDWYFYPQTWHISPPPHPWYIEPNAYGLSNPIYGILNPSPWYIETPAYNILPPPPTHVILNPLLMIF